jgi:hypothetical protein
MLNCPFSYRFSLFQKRKVLSDESLPEEFKLALAESLQQGIFSSVHTRISYSAALA